MKQPSREHILNLWLKYHNTTVEEIVKKHPKEVLKDIKWFDLYSVTQEQHDEWVNEAKKYIKSITKLSKKYIDRKWGLIYLDCAPNIIK